MHEWRTGPTHAPVRKCGRGSRQRRVPGRKKVRFKDDRSHLLTSPAVPSGRVAARCTRVPHVNVNMNMNMILMRSALLWLSATAAAIQLTTRTTLPGVTPARAQSFLATPSSWPSIVLSSRSVTSSSSDSTPLGLDDDGDDGGGGGAEEAEEAEAAW